MMNSLDRNIILALQQDGRTNIGELSRQLRVSHSMIHNRLKALEDQEVMKVRALPNPHKLGYNAHAFIAIEASNNKVNNICSHLNDIFNVNLVVTAFGRFDILASVYFPTWNDLLDFVSSDLSKTEGVDIIETYLVKEFKKRYYGFAVDDINPVKIDQNDQRIIEKLTEHGRLTNRYLAESVGISPPTCSRRVSRLLKSGVIAIKAIPNPSKIGYAANAFMFLRIQDSQLDTVCATLQSYKDVFLIMTLFNGYDLIIGINAATPEQLYCFKDRILTIDGIVHDETIVRAEIKKRYYGGFLE